MSIVQYSKIQHRRGLLVDLPPALNTSELGHVTDERRLFIGNGQLNDGAPLVGNTEIITDFTLLSNPAALKYIFRGNTPVVATTGTDAQHPIVRSVGQFLDDRVSVKSYGAMGDGLSDDTPAINRALKDLFATAAPSPSAAQMQYRALYFPAGVYNISDFIYFPPNTVLVGDGELRTIILQSNSTKNAVAKTADSLFQNSTSGPVMGANSAVLPNNILVNGITFQHSYDTTTGGNGNIALIRLERAADIKFVKCGFLGAWTGGNTLSSAIYLDNLSSGVLNFDDVNSIHNIKFDNCAFLHTNYVIAPDSSSQYANRILFDFCDYYNCGYGIVTSTDVRDVKLSNSILDSIQFSGLVAGPNAIGVASENNTYKNFIDGSSAAITFQSGAQQCSSIADKFYNNAGTNISDSGTNSIILNNLDDFTFQNIVLSSKRTYSLPANSSDVSVFNLDLTKQNSFFIDYSLVVGSIVRTGRIEIYTNKLNNPGSDIVFSEAFSESQPSGITFNYSYDSINYPDIITVTYSSTNLNPATLNLQIKSWLS